MERQMLEQLARAPLGNSQVTEMELAGVRIKTTQRVVVLSSHTITTTSTASFIVGGDGSEGD